MSRTSESPSTAAGLIAIAALTTGCTTQIQPTVCERGATACAGIHDARFCEYVALALEGSACAEVGLVETKPFCVVTTRACVATNYAVRDHDCRVLRYEGVRDAMRAECPQGAPMFVTR